MSEAVWVYFVISAILSYLFSGVNPAIIISRLVYHEDIRTHGSGNPGFTNFKRVYGGKWAWVVFALDLLKTCVICTVFGLVFRAHMGDFRLGAAWAALFGQLGHVYPVWYCFRGGKGFLVCAAAVWFVDWRAALIALIVMLTVLYAKKYMSLAVICAALTCPVSMAAFGGMDGVWCLCTASALFLVARHKSNIKRLIEHKEPKFRLKG